FSIRGVEHTKPPSVLSDLPGTTDEMDRFRGAAQGQLPVGCTRQRSVGSTALLSRPTMHATNWDVEMSVITTKTLWSPSQTYMFTSAAALSRRLSTSSDPMGMSVRDFRASRTP